MLPYLPLWVVGFACLQAGNLYGFDGSALWQTLTIPGAGRVDVRGRQLGWLLIVAPVALLLAMLVPGATSHLSAYPWVLGLTPALLGGGAGLLLLLSVFAAFPVPDQRLHANPFSIAGGRPGCAAWLLQLAMALLLALAALPVLAVLLTAHFTEVDSLRWAAIPVGIATGALLAWWWGRIAYLRLDARGPELLDLVRKGR
jgi:ABC-2 type transport system permease protein